MLMRVTRAGGGAGPRSTPTIDHVVVTGASEPCLPFTDVITVTVSSGPAAAPTRIGMSTWRVSAGTKTLAYAFVQR